MFPVTILHTVGVRCEVGHHERLTACFVTGDRGQKKSLTIVATGPSDLKVDGIYFQFFREEMTFKYV